MWSTSLRSLGVAATVMTQQAASLAWPMSSLSPTLRYVDWDRLYIYMDDDDDIDDEQNNVSFMTDNNEQATDQLIIMIFTCIYTCMQSNDAGMSKWSVPRRGSYDAFLAVVKNAVVNYSIEASPFCSGSIIYL